MHVFGHGDEFSLPALISTWIWITGFKMGRSLNERRLARNRAHLRQLTQIVFGDVFLTDENRSIVMDFGMRTLEYGAYLTAFPEDARRKLDMCVLGIAHWNEMRCVSRLTPYSMRPPPQDRTALPIARSAGRGGSPALSRRLLAKRQFPTGRSILIVQRHAAHGTRLRDTLGCPLSLRLS